jgi:hypothetical protein
MRWKHTIWEYAHFALQLLFVFYEEKQYSGFAAFQSSDTEDSSCLGCNTAAVLHVWFLASNEHVAFIFMGQVVFLDCFTLDDGGNVFLQTYETTHPTM